MLAEALSGAEVMFAHHPSGFLSENMCASVVLMDPCPIYGPLFYTLNDVIVMFCIKMFPKNSLVKHSCSNSAVDLLVKERVKLKPYWSLLGLNLLSTGSRCPAVFISVYKATSFQCCPVN